MATHRTRSKPSQTKSETKPKSRRWSHHVMETSDALDIGPDIFRSCSPAWIMTSLRASAEHSRRHEGTAFQSAMSILTFYINWAGHNLNDGRRRIPERVKVAPRAEFDRPTQSAAEARH